MVCINYKSLGTLRMDSQLLTVIYLCNNDQLHKSASEGRRRCKFPPGQGKIYRPIIRNNILDDILAQRCTQCHMSRVIVELFQVS